MARRSLLAWALLVAAACGAVVASPPARADDPSPSVGGGSVARLSAEELAALHRRFPGWDELAPALRERIAANVLRLRALTPEQRDLLLQRARRAEAAGISVLADLPRRMSAFRGFGPEQQRSFRERGRVQRVAVAAVLREQTPEARALLDPRQPNAISESERREFDAAVSAHWRRVVSETIAKRVGGERGVEPELAPGTPPDVAARVDRLLQELRKPGPPRPGARIELAMLLAQERMRAATSRVPPPEAGMRPDARRAHENALASEIGKAFPEALAAVSSEVAAAAAKGRLGVAAYVRAHVDDAGPSRDRQVVDLLLSIERIRAALPDDAGPHAEALESALLRMLAAARKVVDDDVASFASKAPQDRVAFLLALRRSLAEK